MVDISTITVVYYTLAATSVVIGVIFAVLQLRNLVKARQTDLVIRLYSTFGSKEFREASWNIQRLKLKDYDNYVKKYGWSEIIQVGTLFEGIGVLLHRKLIDIGLVDDPFSEPIRGLWKKMNPL